MHSDARRFFRIQTPEHQQRGLFVLGRQRFQVLMLNASANGFAFLSPQPIQVAAGTIARLQADEAWYKVLVVRSDETDEGMVYGVERLADIASDADDAGLGWGRSRRGEVKSTASTVLAVAGVLLCAALSAYLIAGRPTWAAVLRTVTAGAAAS